MAPFTYNLSFVLLLLAVGLGGCPFTLVSHPRLHLVSAVVTAPRQHKVCSSSAGPYCLEVNGLRAPNYFPKASRRASSETSKSARILLSDALAEWTSGMTGSQAKTVEQSARDFIKVSLTYIQYFVYSYCTSTPITGVFILHFA